MLPYTVQVTSPAAVGFVGPWMDRYMHHALNTESWQRLTFTVAGRVTTLTVLGKRWTTPEWKELVRNLRNLLRTSPFDTFD